MIFKTEKEASMLEAIQKSQETILEKLDMLLKQLSVKTEPSGSK